MLDCFPLPKGPLGEGVGKVGGWQITSYFGPRIDPIRGGPGNHGGEDLSGSTINLQPLYAVVGGYVVQGWDPGGGGNWTTLYAPNGARYGYGHASRYEPGVNGKTVGAGQILAYVGTTGASTGPHLHFAYDSNDPDTLYNDPFDILQECAAAGRYAGTPQPPPAPPEGFTVAQFDELMAGLARIEAAVGTAIVWDAKGEIDTRLSMNQGIERILDELNPQRDPDVKCRQVVEQIKNKVGA